MTFILVHMFFQLIATGIPGENQPLGIDKLDYQKLRTEECLR